MKTIFVLLLGALSALITAKLNDWTFNFYSLCVFFVIPVGGVIFGFLANSGVYLGSRVLRHPPGTKLFATIIFTSTLAAFLHYYITYKSIRIGDSLPISAVMSFWEFVKISVTSAEITVGTRRGVTGNLGSVGSAGYFLAIVEYVGALLGGIGLYAVLDQIPRCGKCENYQDTVAKKMVSFFSIPARYDFQRSLIETDPGSPEFMKALELAKGRQTKETNTPKAKISLFRCRDCKTQTLEVLELKTSDNEKDITTRIELPRGLAVDRYFR